MATQTDFPLNWRIGQDFDPNEHLMQLKGRDYLNVQNRLLWFIRDQRALIVAGLAKMPYIVQTDLVEMDKQTSWAHFKTYVRDVLGNEATMYGSESAKDFGDFAEKASTKSLGRALLALGYGTAFAPEMDEGERVVDSPVERKPAPHQQQAHTRPAADDTRKVVTPQIAKDRARIEAEPTADADITYTVEVSPTVTDADGLIQLSLVEQIKKLKDELGYEGAQWERMKKAARSQDELLAKLQELAEDKRDGFPLDKPAKKAARA